MLGKKILSLAAMILLGALAVPVLAQNAGGPGGGPGGGGGGFGGGGPGGGGPGGGFGGPGGGNFDPAQFMQMRLQRIQTQLGASDDEFAVLSPKIQKVMTAQQAANSGGGRGGGFGGGGPGGGGPGGGGPGGGGPGGGGGFGGGPGGPPNNGQPLNAVQQARQDVMTLLQDPNAPADQIKAKLDAYRDAIAKANDELTAAQNDLKSLLTQRQEAILVMSNILK